MEYATYEIRGLKVVTKKACKGLTYLFYDLNNPNKLVYERNVPHYHRIYDKIKELSKDAEIHNKAQKMPLHILLDSEILELFLESSKNKEIIELLEANNIKVRHKVKQLPDPDGESECIVHRWSVTLIINNKQYITHKKYNTLKQGLVDTIKYFKEIIKNG